MLTTLDAAGIIHRLESAWERDRAGQGQVQAPAGVLLAFDGDGTLWDGDIGVEIFEALLACSGIREAAREALLDEARQFGVRIGDGADDAHDAHDAHAIARALHEAFLDGRYPDRSAYAMNAWAFAGWTAREMDAFADDVLGRGGIDARQHEGVRPVLEWAARRGVDAYVVSASPRAAVRRAAAGLGFSDDRILAMTPGLTGGGGGAEGSLEPRIQGPITYGEGKLVAINEARPGALLLGAFGDSAWDAAMMRAASVPVAVRPGPGLIAIAASIPGLTVLEV